MAAKIPVWEYSNSKLPLDCWNHTSPPRSRSICTPDWGHPSPGPREPLHRAEPILKETCWKRVKGRLPGLLHHDNRGPWASTCLSKAPRKSHFYSYLSILYQMQWLYFLKSRSGNWPCWPAQTLLRGYMRLDICKGMSGDKQIVPL